MRQLSTSIARSADVKAIVVPELALLPPFGSATASSEGLVLRRTSVTTFSNCVVSGDACRSALAEMESFAIVAAAAALVDAEDDCSRLCNAPVSLQSRCLRQLTTTIKSHNTHFKRTSLQGGCEQAATVVGRSRQAKHLRRELLRGSVSVAWVEAKANKRG